MTEYVLDDSPGRTRWQVDFEQRRRASYTAVGLGTAAADRMLERLRETADEWTVARIVDAGAVVGRVAVAVSDDHGTLAGRIGDLHVDAEHAGRGYEQAAREWAEQWCADRGAHRVDVALTEPGGELFAGYGLRAQTRARLADPPPQAPGGVTARRMTEADFTAWLSAERASYVAGIVRAGALSREDAVRKSDRDFARLLPDGLATPDTTLLVLEAASGEPIGTGWLRHGHLPGVTYGYSLHVQEQHRGKGYGRAAMAVGERATLAAGDTTLMFTVWGGNDVAMSLYTSAGYGVVEENRSLDLPRTAV
jgi:GNAT superfamily N-acetyltransferase